ncbi:MAG: PH domain-containing protein, partial [Dehalococcoidia bacterium]|nr:PH domain-containing protein [Dehalococcoidia bacterium]
MTDYEETLYEETVPMGTWVIALVGLVLLVVVGTMVGVILNGVPTNDRIGLPISALVTVVIALVFWNYREIRIRVTGHALEARYGVLNKTVIPLSEIESCQPTKARFGRYLGVGVRMG